MNFIAYAIVLTAALLGLLASFVVHAEEGNSTYNFYFQKAPGPVTVNQGGAPAAANVVAPVGAPAPVVIQQQQTSPALPPSGSVSTVPALEETGIPKRFFLSMGYALTNPIGDIPTDYQIYSGAKDRYLSGQFALKAEYEINNRFAVTGEVYKLKNAIVTNDTHSFDRMQRINWGNYNLPREEDVKTTNVMDFGMGGVLNLVRLRSTTLSLLGGVLTVPKVHYEEFRPGTSRPQDGVLHEKTFYGGARLRLIADNVWGLDMQYKMLFGLSTGVAQVGLTFAL